MTDPISALREVLAKVPELKDQLEAMDLAHPLSGSLLLQDRLAGWGGSLPGSFASSKLEMAADHLFAWQCLTGGSTVWLPVYAHLTLLRPAIEASVQARWLLDPAADPRARIARALGVATMATYKESANPKTTAALTRIAVRHLDRAIQDLGHYLEPGSRN
jgi:hypothetical protein